MKMHSNILGHINKMASIPIYGKNLLQNEEADDLEAWYTNRYQMCSNDDTGLILTILMTWSILFPNASAWETDYIA